MRTRHIKAFFMSEAKETAGMISRWYEDMTNPSIINHFNVQDKNGDTLVVIECEHGDPVAQKSSEIRDYGNLDVVTEDKNA